MARTSLLRSIIRTARELQLAERRNISIDDLRDRMAERRADQGGFTRRQFLTGIGMAAAGLALSHRVTANSRAKLQPRIAIVGAGVSGLNCALTLADHGLTSTIYEASSRCGGRMFSNNMAYWTGGQVTEWCGELIDTAHLTIQGLAGRFGLVLDDLQAAEPAGSEETYFFDGGFYPRPQVLTDFAPVFAAVQSDADAADYPTTYNTSTAEGRRLDRLSVWDWIEKRVPGGHQSRMGQLLDVAYAIEYGADTGEQSSLNLVYLLSGSDEDFETFGDSDERYHVRGGNELIPRAMAGYLETLGQPVQTGSRLVAIRRRADGVYRLLFDVEGGSSDVAADLVVLTVPFAVLRMLDCSRAGFHARKQKVIEQLGRGHNGKLQLQFNARLWNQAMTPPGNGTSFSDTGYQNTWDATRAQLGDQGILNDYTGGSVSDRMATRAPFAFAANPDVSRAARTYLNQIDPVLPNLVSLWNGKATSSLPHLSPFFNCSYSFWQVGQYHSLAGYEAVRQGNIFFAGEHTSIDFQGFMEGAAAEGERAAREILAHQGIAAANYRQVRRSGQAQARKLVTR